MTALEQGLSIGLGIGILMAVTALCLREPPGGARAAEGTQAYRIHAAWFIFAALGGVFLSGLFAFASFVCPPDQRAFCLGCSVVAALGFAFFAVVMRSLRVTVDAEKVTSTHLFCTRSVALRDVERIGVAGFMVEVRPRPDPANGKRRTPLVFFAGFRDTSGLIATVRARAGLDRQ
jgi:hypothetical protein